MATSFGAVIPVTGLNLGFVGQVTRLGKRGIAARPVLASTPNAIPFGAPVVIIPGAAQALDAYQSVKDFIAGSGTFTAARFAGVCNREVKTNLTTFNAPYTPPGVATFIGSYAPGTMCEAIEEGSVTVAIPVGAPISQAPVWVRTVVNGGIPLGIVGDFEAVQDGSNTVSLTGICIFRTGYLDANSVAEITLLNRVAA